MLSPLRLLLALIDEAFDRGAWHGPTLLGSLRGVTARQAAWRPGPRRHNIWEVIVHAAYWKYAVRRRLTGEKRGSFALKGSNWFERPFGKLGAGNERTWEEDVRLLIDQHRKLRAVIADLPVNFSARINFSMLIDSILFCPTTSDMANPLGPATACARGSPNTVTTI